MPICYLTVGWLAKKDISVKKKMQFLPLSGMIFSVRGMLVLLWQVLKRSNLEDQHNSCHSLQKKLNSD